MITLPELKDLQKKICQNNDQHAFGQLFIAYMPYLKQFAFSIIKSNELSEEIVSDVFIKIWQNRASVCKVENFKLYLYISTKNTALNYLSRHYRKEIISLDEMSLNISTNLSNPEQILITSEAIKKIDLAIQNLPPKCKLIFKLVKEDKLKYNDIAQLLNISVKTIDNQMAIAIRKLSASIRIELKNA
jgi:RNA polymerase sigma-70 factor (family 1)